MFLTFFIPYTISLFLGSAVRFASSRSFSFTRLPFLKTLLLRQCRLARVNKTRIALGADVPPAVTGPCLPGGLLPGGEGCPGPAGRLPSWPEGRCRLPVPTVAGCREKRSNWGVGHSSAVFAPPLPCPLACGGPGSRRGFLPSGDAQAKPLLSRAHTSLQSTCHSFGLSLRKELNGRFEVIWHKGLSTAPLPSVTGAARGFPRARRTAGWPPTLRAPHLQTRVYSVL